LLQSETEKVYLIRFNATDSGSPNHLSGIAKDEEIIIDDLPKGSISHTVDKVNGGYNFTIRAWDLKGDKNEALSFCTLYYGDGNTITADDLGEGATCYGTANISTECGGECYISYTYTTAPTGGGAYVPHIVLIDQMGAITTINDTPIFDPLPPDITINSPGEDSILNNKNVSLSITASDAISGIKKIWFVNCTGGIQAYTVPRITRCQEGEHTINAYAEDMAGNVGGTGVTFQVNISAS
jgi:hypothetical protein